VDPALTWDGLDNAGRAVGARRVLREREVREQRFSRDTKMIVLR
jgi:hypothetical protein